MRLPLLFLLASGVTGWTITETQRRMPFRPSRQPLSDTNVENDLLLLFPPSQTQHDSSCKPLIGALALGVLTVATTLPASAVEDRAWDLYTATTTTPTTGMFAPPNWRQRQAWDALRRNQDFQDARLAQCIDRGSLWELCYWYGVRDGEATSEIIAPSTSSSSEELSTTTTLSAPVSRRPPTW